MAKPQFQVLEKKSPYHYINIQQFGSSVSKLQSIHPIFENRIKTFDNENAEKGLSVKQLNQPSQEWQELSSSVEPQYENAQILAPVYKAKSKDFKIKNKIIKKASSRASLANSRNK